MSPTPRSPRRSSAITASPRPTRTRTTIRPSHTEDTHSLMQRGSDIAFLRMLARRSGKVCRVACADQPGVSAPAISPRRSSTAIRGRQSGDQRRRQLDRQRARPRVGRHAAHRGHGALRAVQRRRSGRAPSAIPTIPAWPRSRDQTLATFTGKPMTVLLATAVDSAGELTQRAQGVLREAGWFARCEGEADVERLGVVLRAGMLVALVGVGALHSGTWIVWTVRHRLTQEAHKMTFTLLRNAVGAPPAGHGAGGLSGPGRAPDERRAATLRSRGGAQDDGADRRAGAAAQPLLRQVPRRGRSMSTPRPCGSRPSVPAVLGRPGLRLGAGRACRSPATAMASPFCRTPAPASGSSSRAATSPTRSGSGCYWHDGEAAVRRHRQRPGASSPRPARSSCSTSTGGTITVSDQNGNTVTLGFDSGITLQRGGQSVALANGSVNVNNGALEVT